MSERLSDVEARIHTVHQLSAVISAMRGIAAARSREARQHLDGVRAYAKTLGTGIGRVLAFSESRHEDHAQKDAPGKLVIALCAEQGFAGSFSEHILDAATKNTGQEPHELLIVGDRGLLVARERNLSVAWSTPMIAHPEEAVHLANRIIETLFDRLAQTHFTQVVLVHAVPGTSIPSEVAEKRLLPFDFNRFPPAAGLNPPLMTLAPEVLLEKLSAEYIFAELCEAIVLSFAAENEARMRAMIAAHTNVTKTLDGLVTRSRQLRQEEITNELVELAGGAMASTP